MDGDSICVTLVACAILLADDVPVFLHSPVSSSAGSSPGPAQQQTEPSTKEEHSSTKQLLPDPPAHHCFVTKALWGDRELPCSDSSWEQRGGKPAASLTHIHCS